MPTPPRPTDPSARLSPVIVPGTGPRPARVMVVGEGPGDRETRGYWDAQLRIRVPAPFIGPSGDFLTDLLERHAGVRRADCYVTNVVKRQVRGNDTPTAEEVALFHKDLILELMEVRPEVVVAAGAVAARWFLPDWQSMELQHGLADWSTEHGCVVVPCYHPASALHETDNMPAVYWDYTRAGGVIRGEVGLHSVRGRTTEVLTACDFYRAASLAGFPTVLAIDTEDHLESGRPWCLTVSWADGSAAFIRPDDQPALAALRSVLANPDTLLFIHNTMHDLRPLRAMGEVGVDVGRGLDWARRGDYCRVVDTQVLAFEQGRIHTQALKTLSYRLLGVRMDSYQDIVGPVEQQRAWEYLLDAYTDPGPWPRPEPELVWDEEKQEPKFTKPQSIPTRLKRIMGDWEKREGGDKPVDLLDRWANMPEWAREAITGRFGPFPRTDLSHCPEPRARHYACQDADMTRLLGQELMARHRLLDLDRIAVIDHVQIPMVERMQSNGLPSSRKYFEELGAEMRVLQAELAEVLGRAIGREINPNSSEQVAELLYQELGLEPAKLTATGRPSTGKKALQHLRETNVLVEWIMQSREYAKLDDAFCGNIARRTREVEYYQHPPRPIPGGWVTASTEERAFYELMVTRVKTGRLAAKNFNALAIPTRTELGRRIRKGFRARDGRRLGTWDENQIEMRVMAHESADPVMCEIYNRSPRKFPKHERDLHIYTASRIWGCGLLDVSREQRTASKSTGFGILMGITGKGLSDQMRLYGLDPAEWPEDRCEELRREWLRVFKAVADYQENRKAEARRTGQVVDMFGRRHLLPHARIPLSWIAEEAARQAHALPIQGAAQAIEKLAMGRVWAEVLPGLRELGYCEPVLQVHDELILEFDEGLAEVLDVLMLAVLTDPPVPMRVPLEASGAVGQSWGDLEK